MVIDSGNGMSKFFSKVYMWMFIGLLVSGGAAYFTAHNMAMMKFVYGSFGFILLLELVVVPSHEAEGHVAIFSAGLEAPFDVSFQGVVPDQ